jgi:hypothetical protein
LSDGVRRAYSLRISKTATANTLTATTDCTTISVVAVASVSDSPTSSVCLIQIAIARRTIAKIVSVEKDLFIPLLVFEHSVITLP